MADEEKNEDSGGGSKSGSKMLMIIIGSVVVVLLLVGVALVLLLSGGSNTAQADTPQRVAANTGGGGGGGSLPLNIGPLYPIEGSVVVNLISTSSQKRYLKTSLTLELSQEGLRAEMEAKKDAIKDTIISILSAKSPEEVQTTKGKERLKEEIMTRLNEFLVDGKINNIFFTEFVVS